MDYVLFREPPLENICLRSAIREMQKESAEAVEKMRNMTSRRWQK